MDLSEVLKLKDPLNVIRHPWELARYKVVFFLLSKSGRLPFNHLLDVGAGDGFILHQLIKNNAAINFSAIDAAFDDAIMQKMKAWTGTGRLELYRGIKEMRTGTEPIDGILLLDVLEHIADDEDFITEIQKHALGTTNTSWLITVPAFQTLFSKHDKQLKHYRRYNLEQLLTLCKNRGLHIDDCGYFFFSLIPLRILQKIKLTFSKKDTVTTIENWKGGKFLANFIKHALWIDFRIGFWLGKLSIRIPGLSCYCICH